MTDFEQRDNDGVLFINPEDKRATDLHPHYKGKAVVNGVECWVSGWKKESKAGQPYLSLSFTPKDEAPKSGATSSTEQEETVGF